MYRKLRCQNFKQATKAGRDSLKVMSIRGVDVARCAPLAWDQADWCCRTNLLPSVQAVWGMGLVN